MPLCTASKFLGVPRRTVTIAEKIQALIFFNNGAFFVLKTYVIFYINPIYFVNKQLSRKKDDEGKTKRRK